uniref:Uncharacterized protein n=1 Tax=Cannabis sativa TaxID=3483 RepID=A0A803P7X7_CANSA
MVAWQIWNARNDVLWKGRVRTTVSVVLKARSYLNQWLCAQKNRMEPILLQNDQGLDIEHWTKPVTNTVNVNVDKAIFASIDSFGKCVSLELKEEACGEGKHFSTSLPIEIRSDGADSLVKSYLNVIKIIVDVALFGVQNAYGSFGLVARDANEYLVEALIGLQYGRVEWFWKLLKPLELKRL